MIEQGESLPGKLLKSSSTALNGRSRTKRLLAILSSHPDWIAACVTLAGFLCRAWLAHATFFNPDEAWHFAAANQESLYEAYQASTTLFHPPLLILILYFWRGLGTSDLVLRLPCVIAGTLFCWFYYKWLKRILGRQVAWVGLLFVTFLPTLISMSADLRQYPLLLMFSAAAAYLLEKAFENSSAGSMVLSVSCMLLAMLSHYSGFLVALSMGLYAIFRFVREQPSVRIAAAWMVGQVAGLAMAWFFYSTQIKQLTARRGTESLKLVANWYLPEFYYHAGHGNLFSFLLRGTFGIFRFTFGWAVAGYLAAVLFLASIVLLLRLRRGWHWSSSATANAFLLLSPFAVSWAAAAAGVYPFGRTRHSIFLAMYGIAGLSFMIAEITKWKKGLMLTLTVTVIVLCQTLGTQPWRDMLPLADRRKENMDQAIDLLRRQVSPADIIYVDKATELQIAHYLCDQRRVDPERSVPGFESFRCGGLRVVSTSPRDDALLMLGFTHKRQEMAQAYGLKAGSRVWIVQGGWNSGFGENLRQSVPEFSDIEIHNFGHYLEVFGLEVASTAFQ